MQKLTCQNNNLVITELTEGKEYEILDTHDEVYLVVNDLGEEETYGKLRFSK